MNLAFRLAGRVDDGRPRLPGSLEVNRRLGDWLDFSTPGVVEARSGKVELGQGILTALAQIVADELDVGIARVRMRPAETGSSPDEAVTSGSLSIQESGTALGHAAAEARALFVAAAAARAGCPGADLRVSDGRFLAGASDTGLDYWCLSNTVSLDREASGTVPRKAADALRVVGRSLPRGDLTPKVMGQPHYIHDLDWPGMLHGAVLRPPRPGARLAALDEASARGTPAVRAIVRDGSFAGVVAANAGAVQRALETLRSVAQWEDGTPLPPGGDPAAWLKSRPVDTSVPGSHGDVDAVRGARAVEATFTRPYLAHASIAPSCALARWSDDRSSLEVWSHSQGIYNLRTDLALAFAMPTEAITVRHVESAGCYGHNGADDVAYDAALLARAAPGRVVRVQWSRADELGWAPLGPAMAVTIRVELDAGGEVLAWRHAVWSNGHGTRPGRAKTPALLAATMLERPFERLIAVNAALAAGGGAERNAIPGYAFPAWRTENHRVLDMPLRTSALRSLGAFANVFAIESVVDELAHARGEDPLAWRVRHMDDPRGRAVLERVALLCGWHTRRRVEGRGFGLGYARYKNTGAYCAVVAEIEAAEVVRATRLWIAVDCGRVVNPDGVANQIEGGAIQATSWALKEAVTWDREALTSTSWEAYPILRFSEVPAVEVAILDHPDLPSLGAGEAAHGPVAGALGNAVRDALGARVRALPLTPEHIAAAGD